MRAEEERRREKSSGFYLTPPPAHQVKHGVTATTRTDDADDWEGMKVRVERLVWMLLWAGRMGEEGERWVSQWK